MIESAFVQPDQGVTVDQARVATVIFGKSLRDRDEEEVGYRRSYAKYTRRIILGRGRQAEATYRKITARYHAPRLNSSLLPSVAFPASSEFQTFSESARVSALTLSGRY